MSASHMSQMLQLARTNFLLFLQLAFSRVLPGSQMEVNWHHEAIAALIEQVIAAPSAKAMILIPPRHLKSYIISICLPAYLLGQDPRTSVVVSTYSDTLTEDFSAGTARLMESELYRRIFPATILTRRTRRKLETTMGGFRLATTVGGPITGSGGDYLIADDPLNAINAHSEAFRKQANDYFDQSFVTRANRQNTAKILLVMQRLHEADTAGHLLTKGSDWTQLKLQARATEDVDIPMTNGRVHKVRVGDYLQPSRFGPESFDDLRANMGSTAFEAQYQQNPIPAEGNQIKAEWLHHYQGTPPPSEVIVQSWDVAQKQGVANDYSVCTTWRVVDGKGYLVDVWRGRVDFPQLVTRTIDLYNQFRPSHLLIEDTGSGTALFQQLRTMGLYNVIACRPKIDKVARVEAASGAIQAGRVLFPEQAPFLGEFLLELLGFPNMRHDDQVDSTTQFVFWLNERHGSDTFIVSWI